jgi:hypothetical protein
MHDAVVREHVPDSNDNLLLDIGGDTGARVLYAAADPDPAEIEISPAASDQAASEHAASEHAASEHARTHNVVRRREAPGGAVYAAVFPALAAGNYVVWRDSATRAGTVLVRGGEVSGFRLN